MTESVTGDIIGSKSGSPDEIKPRSTELFRVKHFLEEELSVKKICLGVACLYTFVSLSAGAWACGHHRAAAYAPAASAASVTSSAVTPAAPALPAYCTVEGCGHVWGECEHTLCAAEGCGHIWGECEHTICPAEGCGYARGTCEHVLCTAPGCDHVWGDCAHTRPQRTGCYRGYGHHGR